MRISMFINLEDPHGHMPKLKGKAAEVKALIPALVHVWKFHMDALLVEHVAILDGLQSSVLMDNILDGYPDVDVWPNDALKVFVDASWNYARCQNAVAAHYNRFGFLLFDVTIKTHWTLHCAMEAPFLNPRRSWNYIGEDFMSKSRDLHTSCCKGNSPASSATQWGTHLLCLTLVVTSERNKAAQVHVCLYRCWWNFMKVHNSNLHCLCECS